LRGLGGLGNLNKTLMDFLTHIGCKEEYSNAWKEAVKLNDRSLVPRLDAVATFVAVQPTFNMNQTQMKNLFHSLFAEIGSSISSTETNRTQTLRLEYVEPLVGV
jgi:hypothetical protein